jgi:hypothetical protein
MLGVPLWRVRQLRDIRRNPSCLIFRQQPGCRPSPWLILEINVGKRLAVVAHNKASEFFSRPW